MTKNKIGKDVTYARIEWKRVAKKFKVGGNSMKKILLMRGNTIQKTLPYKRCYVNWIKEDLHLPIIPNAKGNYPDEIVGKKAKVTIPMGRIEL